MFEFVTAVKWFYEERQQNRIADFEHSQQTCYRTGGTPLFSDRLASRRA
jgi:hypothetical protein